jgi:uncharacterized LabA/DUF88 family protein
MVVLVDYDNVPELERHRGIVSLVDKVLSTITVSPLLAYQRSKFKLYGGWYEGNRLSRAAQRLAIDIGVFPRAFSLSDGTDKTSVIVQVDLAYSLEIDPRNNLENTYRSRGLPQGLRCDPPPYPRCINSGSCPIAHVHPLINSGNCPEVGCRVTSADILVRSEQKLVDTMMTADMIYLATRKTADICVVSSDDDLWPGIKSALLFGANVYHIHTKPGRGTPSYYSRGAGSRYVELSLR